MIHKKSNYLLAMLLFVLMSGLQAKEKPGVILADAYVRAPIPGQKIAAAFVTIHNTSAKALILTNISTAAAKSVEVHQMKTVDGQMRMRKVEALSIPAKGKLDMKAQGYHLMLMGIKNNLQESANIELELCFDTLCSTVQMPVQSVLTEKK